MNDIKDITAVSSVEFKKHFGRYREEAQRAPVGITNHGRVSSVLISAADYAEFLKLKNGKRGSGWVWELPDDVKADIAAAAEHEITEEEIAEAEAKGLRPYL